MKNCIIERWNRTLETRLFQYLTSRNSLRYVDALQQLVDGINNRPSRALHGLSPAEVYKSPEKRRWLEKKFQKDRRMHDLVVEKYESKKTRLRAGDLVRIRNKRTKFERGYKPGFSEEIYKIRKVIDTSPTTYLVGQKRRAFYINELVNIIPRPAGEGKLYNFVEKSRKVASGHLRSGKPRAFSTENLQKNYNDSSISRWASQPSS